MPEGNVMLWEKLQERLKGHSALSQGRARREVTRKVHEVTGALRKHNAAARAARAAKSGPAKTDGGSAPAAQSRTATPSRSHRSGSLNRRKATAAKSVRKSGGGSRRGRSSGRKTAPRTASAAYRRTAPARGYEEMQRELDARVNAAMEIRRGIEAKIDRGLAELDAEKRAAGKKRGRK